MTEQETIADILAEMRRDAETPREHIRPDGYGEYETVTIDRDEWLIAHLDRLEAAHKRGRVLAVSIMRSKLYGIAGGLRAITARSDARQRGIHYTEVQNIAAQIENIADNGGEA